MMKKSFVLTQVPVLAVTQWTVKMVYRDTRRARLIPARGGMTAGSASLTDQPGYFIIH